MDALSFADALTVQPLLTPRIFLVLHQAFVLMRVNNASDARKGWFFLRRLSFNTSRTENNESTLPNFSSEELQHIHDFIVEAARANQFNDEEAKQFAKIIVGRLDITQTLGGQI